MKHTLMVRSTVIDYRDKTIEITDTEGKKYIVPLGQSIYVHMIGYPDPEERAMLAGELGEYMSQGYVIKQIEFEGTIHEQ